VSTDYSTIADDIEWLRDEWWQLGNDPSHGHIRRGSATLDLLLRQGMLGQAWRHFEFSGGEPTIEGPDVLAVLTATQQRIDMVVSLIAGGGRVEELQVACFGAFRVDHPLTGVPADAKEGFAASVGGIMRDVIDPTPGDLDRLVCRHWKITDFLRSPDHPEWQYRYAG